MQPTDAGRGLRRAAIAIACLLALAFLAAWLARLHARHTLVLDTAAQAAAPPTVDVAVVRNTQADGELTLPGETAAWYQSTIYARVSGYVGRWLVDIGDHVGTGQTLAVIETPELDAELDAAKAKLQVAEAQVRIGAADAELARSTYARWRDSPKGVVSEQERESKKAEDASAAARLEAARAQLRLDQADVKRLTALTRFKQVTAPYAGTITQRQIDIGDLVTAGSSSSTTPLFRMAQQDPMRVFVDVPQNMARDLMKNGVPARILTTGPAASTLQGRISRTSDAIDPGTRTFRAQIDVPNREGRLVAGQYVQVAFPLSSAGLRQVPAAALLFRGGTPSVAVVTAAGTVEFRSVSIARDDGATLELASGVSAGDRVVLNISSQIIEGQKVKIAAPDAPLHTAAVMALRTP